MTLLLQSVGCYGKGGYKKAYGSETSTRKKKKILTGGRNRWEKSLAVKLFESIRRWVGND